MLFTIEKKKKQIIIIGEEIFVATVYEHLQSTPISCRSKMTDAKM
jgi:hypothetical protein